MSEPVRIQKYLASLGIASRREIERMITAGRIRVNDAPVVQGQKVTEKDDIQIDGRPLRQKQTDGAPRFVIYNKPEGEVCTRNDPEGRPRVFDALPPLKGQRWINVGRLDVNTSGLLLFTTDGDLAHRLMHPSTQVQREYAVRIHGEVTPAMVKRLVTGVALEDGEARFEDVAHAGGPGTNQWFYVLLTEGRNRLVRRLWESQGVQVTRLKRVRFGPMTLPSNLSPGEIAWIKKDDIRQLYESVGLPVPDRLGVENAIVGTRQARHRR